MAEHTADDDSGNPTSTGSIQSREQGVDEIKAVREGAKRDTFNVQVWRSLLAAALLITAIAITWTTYNILDNEQDSNFVTAFDQFSRTVSDSAIDQQRRLRVAYRQLSNAITIHAISTNQTWPFFTMPYFQTLADTFLEQSQLEVITVFHRIERDEQDEWANYTTKNHEAVVQGDHMQAYGSLDRLNPVDFHPFISQVTSQGFIPDIDRDFYYASWNFGPPPFSYGFVNWNPFSIPMNSEIGNAILALRNQTILTRVQPYIGVGTIFTQEEHDKFHSDLKDSSTEHPHSFIFHAVYEKVGDYNSKIVAMLSGGGSWDAALRNLLPNNVRGVVAVIENSCDQAMTYVINGGDAIFQGDGDLHDPKYDDHVRIIDLSLNDHADFRTTPGHCSYSMSIYPSAEFAAPYDTFTPERFAIIIAATFLVVALVFFVYDMFVHRRNEKLVENAAQSNAIVSSLFPTNIRARIIAQNQGGGGGSADKRIANLKNYLAGHIHDADMDKEPLADLFLETTILFADISGFTAWSSIREPSQVFSYLEKLFSSFDRIAKARRVFKVETVADCYVAATGIPEPRDDHAVVMIRFARDILSRMHSLSKELEVTHGPDTGDLSLRVGVNSGPVTAGVLRGERARFQLFGDTMNTASRIENTGEVNRIHVSSATAVCLQHCNKGHWLAKRDTTVEAKGKGLIQTYWIASNSETSDQHSCHSGVDELDIGAEKKTANSVRPPNQRSNRNGVDERTSRLVDWNVEMLSLLIRKIMAHRNALELSKEVGGPADHSGRTLLHFGQELADEHLSAPLDEVKEIIHLPAFDATVAKQAENPNSERLDEKVILQLRHFVTCIAQMYRSNAFHSFEHASHVTMSVIKLLARIVAPKDDLLQANGHLGSDQDRGTIQHFAAALHDHTYGITSDPLIQFACAFSALIHDVDHSGVPNAQLVKENDPVNLLYKGRSVAEQNSLVLAWDLFTMDDFADLRSCVCATSEELGRFRQLVINSVMATDIVDKPLKQLRNARWEKAFSYDDSNIGDRGHEENQTVATNRKATIVIEHLIQASDVAHTMQHWHVYRKWNDRFFRECYAAYKSGRAESNPVDTWYKGEIGFFDFYIIPLAKKLKECGVFGKSSDEYLNYALDNRKEWESRGEQIVAEMAASVDGRK